MFDSCQKSTGSGYTTMVALLTVAFIFIPAILLVLRPVGYVSVALAIACSLLCVTLAWVNWKKSSQLSIPSIAIQRGTAK
jgi:small-conductance mechanosensitive channel